MASHDPIAYTYEADTHCPSCARARFGVCPDGFTACAEHGALDREGNGPGAVFPWDEWCDASADGRQTLACGTCRGVIEEHEHSGTGLAQC